MLFDTSGLPTVAGIFAVSALAVWMAGYRLSFYADALAERWHLPPSSVGFLGLAIGTQLPEIVTNTTAALRDNAALVLNGMFGGVTLQTFVLVIADAATAGIALTHRARRSGNLLQAAVLILLLAIKQLKGSVPFTKNRLP